MEPTDPTSTRRHQFSLQCLVVTLCRQKLSTTAIEAMRGRRKVQHGKASGDDMRHYTTLTYVHGAVHKRDAALALI